MLVRIQQFSLKFIIMKKLSVNLKIISKLIKVIIKNPNMNFGEILLVYNFIDCVFNTYDETYFICDPYHENSEETLERINDL